MPTSIEADPPELPPVLTWKEALGAGFTPDQIRHRLRSGTWERLLHGVYLRRAVAPRGGDRFDEERRRHINLACAAARRLPGSVISSSSAAVLYGFPLVTGIPPLVDVVVPRASWVGIRNGVRRRHWKLEDVDVALGDIPLTTPSRTWLDVTRERSFSDSLSAGDAALRLGLVSRSELEDCAARFGAARGFRRIERALPHLDGLRESPLESWSWSHFVEWRFPLPVVQREIRDSFERHIARVDFAWDDIPVIGEADGLGKYKNLEAFAAEKEREEQLRDLGFTVVRWMWRDLARTPDRLRFRLASALQLERRGGP